MAYNPDRDRDYQATKSRIATREPFAVRSSNWDATTNPPTCLIHSSQAIWHKNKARESGGQWVCKDCSRLKSKGQRRRWRTDHTDPFTYNLKRFFILAKYHSKKIDREFDLEFDDVLGMWAAQEGKCAITKTAMDYLPGDRVRKRNKVTMDRIDSSKGYTRNNVWLVCDWVNRAKTDMTKEEMILFANGILSRICG